MIDINTIFERRFPEYKVSLVIDLGGEYFVKLFKPGERMVGGTSYIMLKENMYINLMKMRVTS